MLEYLKKLASTVGIWTQTTAQEPLQNPVPHTYHTMNRDSKGTPQLPPKEPSTSKKETPPLQSDSNPESNKPGNTNPVSPKTKPTLSELGNPDLNRSMLGDPTSLRAEYTDTHPTENDMGAGEMKTSGSPSSNAGSTKNEGGARPNDGNTSSKQKEGRRGESPQGRTQQTQKENGSDQGSGKGNARVGGPTGKGSLADAAKKNSIGDPTSLKSEKTSTEPTENDRGAQGSKDTAKSKL